MTTIRRLIAWAWLMVMTMITGALVVDLLAGSVRDFGPLLAGLSVWVLAMGCIWTVLLARHPAGGKLT